ncbi:tyrosine-protein kinase BAZ1B-like isoform X2 [Panulirus ornatus]|uniref:tyrosine-protein kinase BAZ1B-like isoform X2 n=1 Tax=Panulirus ornatus TaxID=150431 RepID=UPI003A8805A2
MNRGIIKCDYDDRLALYSQSIWTCQCSGKSGLTHQEAWTSEAKVRVLLNSSFPMPLLPPILRTIHHSTLPLDQLVEAASALCYSRFHPGEELTLLGPQPIQVRVINAKEDSSYPIKREYGLNVKNTSSSVTPSTHLSNGCSPISESPMVNGTSNGTVGSEESSPSNGGKGKEDSPGKKKNLLLPLLYDVSVIGEDRVITEVPAKHLQRTYRVPPKEHFRLFVRANAIRQRSSAYTPWIVSEDLVKQYSIPSKLALIFTNPKTNSFGRKRKAEGLIEEKAKKVKAEKVENIKTNKIEIKKSHKASKKPKVKRDPNAPRRKPGPKPGFKRTPKLNQKSELPKHSHKTQRPVKIESSDSDDDVSLAVLANRSPKVENETLIKPDIVAVPGIVPLLEPKKREAGIAVKEQSVRIKKLKQATLFDMRTPKKNGDGTQRAMTTPKRSPQKKQPTAESVLRMPIMKKMVHQYKTLKGMKGTGRKLVHTMDQVLKKLTLQHIEVIPDADLRADILKRHERMMEKRILAKMAPEEREEYLKQKAKEEAEKRMQTKMERNQKMEDKLLPDLKPLPQPQLVPTPEEIPNSLFGDVAMVVEFVECYHEIVKTDKKKSISCSQLMQALAAGSRGFKYVAELMCLLLRLIVDDERIGGKKELGVKIIELPVHYQTAIEIARLCLSKCVLSESASQHSDDNTDEGEEQNELSDGLIHKLESSELYELQPVEVIAVLKALCHQAIASDTALEHVEEIEEKAYLLYKKRAQVKKINLKEEMEKKEQRKQERLQKKMDKSSAPRKTPGRPKGYSPKKNAITIDNFYSKKGEEERLDLASRVKRKRLTTEEINKEKEMTKSLQREQKIKEEEEKRRVFVVQECERVLMQKDMLIRLQPLGVDRNQDRYWLFNNTTPGLYVEKGWVDSNTTYSIQSSNPPKQPPSPVSGASGHNGSQESGSDSDDKPLSAIKEELSTGNAKKMNPLSRPKTPAVDETTQTFPSVGQNMWFYYDSLEKVDELLQSLAEKGQRESRLSVAIGQVRRQLETNLTKEWPPLEELEDGTKQLVESLREDIIQIEHELIEGWLGAVPNPDEWEKKAQEATTLQELGECLVEAQRHMHIKYLKGIMQPSKKLIPSDDTEQPPEYEELESLAVQPWREAVMNCQTFSRMHMLVGMFDSCIKWEKSIATKKCKVCRHQNTTIPLAICDKCESSYHWSCLRPQLKQEPPDPWLCLACHPKKSSRLERLKQNEDAEDTSTCEKEKMCRVCERGLGLIFCCKCPAAYHSECHDPPLQTRARKDWTCVDCSNTKTKRGSKNSKIICTTKGRFQSQSEQEMVVETRTPPKSLVKETKKKDKKVEKHIADGGGCRSLRRTSRRKYVESDDYDDDDDEFDFVAMTRQRRSTRRASSKKNYRISSDDDDEEEEEDITEQEEELEEEDIVTQEEEEDNIEQEEDEDEEEEEENAEQEEEEEEGNVEQEEEEEENAEQEEEEEEGNVEQEEEEEEEEDNGEQDEDYEDHGEQEEEDEEYVTGISCTYCGLGVGKTQARTQLLPCTTCDVTFHRECALKAIGCKNMISYQCSKCLRNGRSPSKSPMKKAKGSDDKENELDGNEAEENDEIEEEENEAEEENEDEDEEEENEEVDDEQEEKEEDEREIDDDDDDENYDEHDDDDVGDGGR